MREERRRRCDRMRSLRRHLRGDEPGEEQQQRRREDDREDVGWKPGRLHVHKTRRRGGVFRFQRFRASVDLEHVVGRVGRFVELAIRVLHHVQVLVKATARRMDVDEPRRPRPRVRHGGQV